MTTPELILTAGLLVNLAGNLSLWVNHQFSAKAERKDLDERLRKVEGAIIAIKTRLKMPLEES